MSLYLEIVIGMQAIGPDIINYIDQCQAKLLQLYSKQDILPWITLQNQKNEILVSMFFQSSGHIMHYKNEIMAEEEKALQTVQLITGIVGNSKSIKLA